MTDQPQFNPAQYKKTTTQQWDAAAKAWDDWGPTLHDWLGPVTELMFDLAGLRPGSQVLDVAPMGGGYTLKTPWYPPPAFEDQAGHQTRTLYQMTAHPQAES